MYNLIKKLFDFFFSLFLFSILLPLILIISLFILFDIGRPIFFLQERTGKNGKVLNRNEYLNSYPNECRTGEVDLSVSGRQYDYDNYDDDDDDDTF